MCSSNFILSERLVSNIFDPHIFCLLCLQVSVNGQSCFTTAMTQFPRGSRYRMPGPFPFPAKVFFRMSFQQH